MVLLANRSLNKLTETEREDFKTLWGDVEVKRVIEFDEMQKRKWEEMERERREKGKKDQSSYGRGYSNRNS